MTASDPIADIAARYGATVAPGVVVQRLPVGVSSRPYPVWDASKNQLVVPDWKEQKLAAKRAVGRKIAAHRRKVHAQDAELVDRIRAMHAAGARLAAMAEATGLSVYQMQRVLRQIGLKVERLGPGQSPAVLAKIEVIRAGVAQGKSRAELAVAAQFADPKYLVQFVGRYAPDIALPAPVRSMAGRKPIRDWAAFHAKRVARINALIAEGADEARMCEVLGLRNRHHLRRMVRKLVPDYLFHDSPCQPRFADRDAQIAGMVADKSIRDIATELGLTVSQVTASVRRSRAAGLVPAEIDANRTRRGRTIPKGVIDQRDRDVLPLARDMSYAEVGQRLGLTVTQVKRSVKRLRVAGLLPSARDQRMPMREGSMNGTAPRHVDRVARILDLHRQSWTVDRITAEVAAPRRSVIEALRRAGCTPRFDKSEPKAARLAELPQLVAQGLTGQDIADRWGKTLKYVYHLASKAKISLGWNARPHNMGDVSPRVAARRKRVRQLYTSGHTYAQMRDLLKVSDATLSADVKALGLSGTSAYALSRAKTKAKAEPEPERRAA